jgi:hypothetical protein
MTQSSYTVLLIGSAGRSGSTLLERMLDQVPGVISVGELTDIWDSGLIRDERCGCGQPFSKCEFWSRVGEVAFGGWQRVDAQALLAMHDTVARNRHVPLLLTGPLPRSARATADGYAAAVGRLYEAIAAASAAGVIVDASKWPSHALILRRIPGLDLRLAHLVRDPRGVAHSWAQRVERPQAIEDRDGAEMRRYRPSVAALHWTTINLGLEIATRLGIPRQVVRYDDLVASPREVLRDLLNHAGYAADESSLGFIHDGVVRVAPGHGIAGNRLRFKHGELRLHPDERWTVEMQTRTRLAVDSVTRPLSLLYDRRPRRSSSA